MLLHQSLFGLYLDNNAVMNPQISVILADHLALILNVDRLLLFDSQSQLFKLDSQRILIDLFEKSSPQCIVNFVRATDDFLGEIVVGYFVIGGSGKLDRIYKINKIRKPKK